MALQRRVLEPNRFPTPPSPLKAGEKAVEPCEAKLLSRASASTRIPAHGKATKPDLFRPTSQGLLSSAAYRSRKRFFGCYLPAVRSPIASNQLKAGSRDCVASDAAGR